MSWADSPVWWLRIAGLGEAGELATLTTRPPPASWSPPSGVMAEAWPVLVPIPAMLQSSTTPLSSDTPDQVLIFSASWRDDRIAPLAAAPAPPASIDSAFVYLTKFHDPADGKLYVSVDASSLYNPGDLVWCAGQCFEVTGFGSDSGGDYIEVNNGQFGTLPAFIRIFYPDPGPSLFERCPDYYGQFATAGYIDADGVEVQTFRGFVRELGASGDNLGQMTIEVAGATNALAKKPMRPRAVKLGADEDGVISQVIQTDRGAAVDWFGVVAFDAGETCGQVLTGVLLRKGEKWAVVRTEEGTANDDAPVEWGAVGATRRFDIWPLKSGALGDVIIAFGEGRTQYDMETLPSPRGRDLLDNYSRDDKRIDWFAELLTAPDEIEPAFLLSVSADLVSAFLVSPVHGLGLESASGWQSSPTLPFSHATAWQSNTELSLAFIELSEGTMLDILADAYGSLACGVAGARDGTVRVIQWTAPTIPDTSDVFVTLNRAPRSRMAWKMRRDRTIARPGYRLTSRYVQNAPNASFSGDVVALNTRTGNVSSDAMGAVEVAPFVGMTAAGNAWSAASAYYGAGAVVVEVSMHGTTTLPDVGDVVTIERADLPAPDGTLGVSSLGGFVFASSVDLETRVASYSMIVQSWTQGEELRATWAPAATVVSWDSGTDTATVAEDDYTTGDAVPATDVAAWALVDFGGGEEIEVLVLNDYFETIDNGTLVAIDTGANEMTITGLSGDPTGYTIIPNSWSIQSSAYKDAPYRYATGGPALHVANNGALPDRTAKVWA